MQRWFRSLAALRLPSQPPPTPLPLRRRVFHSSSSMTKSPLISPGILRPTPSLLLFNTPSPLRLTSNQPSSLPLSLIQVRHLTLKQRKRKLKSRQPPSPVVSKLNKIKIKSYSSFKGRFRTMKDGQIRRWKEGKRHNAHHKSKIAKRRGRLPAIVPPAYAKVMKKLNFCG